MVRRIITAFAITLGSLAVSPLLIAAPRAAITPTELYCSGIVSRLQPRMVGYVITGADASDKLQFVQGDIVYLHVASHADSENGEQFLVVRAAKDPVPIAWFHGQKKLEKQMGRLWKDVGRVRVVKIGKGVATARIESSCAPMQRGDLLVPFEARPAPLLATPSTNISRRASNRLTGRVVIAKKFRQLLASGSIAYVNLGARQGVKVGDCLSLFRYPGSHDLNVYPGPGIATGAMKGFGHAPVENVPPRLPREILGDAIVLRVSPTAATILITESRREIALGDYAQTE